MANNRLWLMHRPSGLAVKLGKHMGDGWYDPPTPELLQALFDETLDFPDGHPDDLCLVMENSDDAPLASHDFQYGEVDAKTGLRQLVPGPSIINPPVLSHQENAELVVENQSLKDQLAAITHELQAATVALSRAGLMEIQIVDNQPVSPSFSKLIELLCSRLRNTNADGYNI